VTNFSGIRVLFRCRADIFCSAPEFIQLITQCRNALGPQDYGSLRDTGTRNVVALLVGALLAGRPTELSAPTSPLLFSKFFAAPLAHWSGPTRSIRVTRHAREV